MKLKKFLFLSVIIFACFGFIIDANAVVDVTTGSNGDGLDASASSNYCSLAGGCWHDGYLGVRVTLVDDNGEMIPGTHYEDFWNNLPINARGKNNSKPRSIYINSDPSGAASESWTDVGDYIDGDVTDDVSLIGGSISYENQHGLIEDQLKKELENYKISKNCGEFKLFNKLGYDDFCSNVLQNSDCDEKIEKIYILVEPLYYVNYRKKNVVLTGTELAAMVFKIRISVGNGVDTYNLNSAAFDNALINMYLTGKDAEYDFKSNGKKYNKFDAYASDFAGVGANIYSYYWHGIRKYVYKPKKDEYGNVMKDDDGNVIQELDEIIYSETKYPETREVINAAVGYKSPLLPLGNSMHLVWLKALVPPDVCEPEPEECCVPCGEPGPDNPDWQACVEKAGKNYHDDDPYCCKVTEHTELIEENGVCGPADEYWDNHEDIYELYCKPIECCDPSTDPSQCCEPSNALICDGNGTQTWDEYWNGKQDLYEEFCGPKCETITLTGNADCEVAVCELNESNVSIFKDPVFNSDNSSIANLVDADGNLQLDKIDENTLKQLATLYENNSFLALAKMQDENYKIQINDYCDLYCQEIAVVTLPDVYPAANAGRYFQWGIDGSDVLIKQTVTKICAEDIKLDKFLQDYYEWMTSVQEYVDVYANFNASCGAAHNVFGFTEAVDGDDPADDYCGALHGCCMQGCNYSCPEVPTCKPAPGETSCTPSQSAIDAHSECVKSIQKCKDNCGDTLSKCQSGYTDPTGKWIPPFSESVKNWRSKFNENGSDSFEGNFKTFLGCFDDSLGIELETNLTFNLSTIGLNTGGNNGVYDSENYFTKNPSEISSTNPSMSICVDSTNDCDESYFSFKSTIMNFADDERNLTCNNYSKWPSTDLLTSGIKYECNSDSYSLGDNEDGTKDYIPYYSVKDFATTAYNSLVNACFDTKKSNCRENETCLDNLRADCAKQYASDYQMYLKLQKNIEATDSSCNYIRISGDDAVRKNSVPNLVEEQYISSLNDLPLKVNDFSDKSGWKIVSNIGDVLLSEDKQNFDWWKTFRLVAQSKEDSYTLNENINACVCSDGTVMDAYEIDGKFYCLCDPEINDNTYYEDSNHVDNASIIENDAWGRCEYSGYDIIGKGGTYTIAYMTGTGEYDLNIDYWNIGSVNSSGVGHFNNMLEICNCPGGICTYAGDFCKLVVGNAIMQDNWNPEFLPWSYKSDYFVCRDECWDGEKYPKRTCPDGECPDNDDVCPCSSEHPECCSVPPPKPDPEYNCLDGECVQGLSLVYRTVDLNNPFPDRTAGENWLGQESKITSNRGLNGNELYSSNEVQPLYYFKFTPSLIKEIRAYNVSRGRDYATSSTIAYPNNRLTNDDGSYNVGISQPLRNDIGSIVADTAFANGDSLDEWIKVPVSEEDCREGFKDGGDGWCYSVVHSWEEITTTYQGDEVCWDLAKTYLGVR